MSLFVYILVVAILALEKEGQSCFGLVIELLCHLLYLLQLFKQDFLAKVGSIDRVFVGVRDVLARCTHYFELRTDGLVVFLVYVMVKDLTTSFIGACECSLSADFLVLKVVRVLDDLAASFVALDLLIIQENFCKVLHLESLSFYSSQVFSAVTAVHDLLSICENLHLPRLENNKIAVPAGHGLPNDNILRSHHWKFS